MDTPRSVIAVSATSRHTMRTAALLTSLPYFVPVEHTPRSACRLADGASGSLSVTSISNDAESAACDRELEFTHTAACRGGGRYPDAAL